MIQLTTSKFCYILYIQTFQNKFIGINIIIFNYFRYSDLTDNPFTEKGILSKKADFIINRSIITRTSLQIADPDQIDEICENISDDLKSCSPIQKDLNTVGHPYGDVVGLSGDEEISEVAKVDSLPKKASVDDQINTREKKICCSLQ